MSDIRVRLAPSPTGDVHIGTIWLAQFNYLFAKQQNGAFILRIEDTDQKRFVPGTIEKIYEALDWMGITPDEGPQQGGEYGPYIQSERLPKYKEAAEQLVASGHAYHCFCTSERLEQLRAEQTAAKLPPRYDKHCASLAKDEVEKRLAAGEASVIRLNMPTTGTITHSDIIRGQVEFRLDLVDDSVLLKSDGFPTYHLAVVVDDHAMKISHVIRAEEWLPSVPKHLYLYQCFGWEPPAFAHLPLILGQDKSKLSKRHGATSALAFRDQGYLASAMQNFLILMGWHPKGDSEVLTREQALTEFTLEEVNPSSAVFDQTKLDWFNGYYIRQCAIPELRKLVAPFWSLPEEQKADTAWQERVLLAIRDRLVRLNEIDGLTRFFLPSEWDTMLTHFDRAMLIPKGSEADQAALALQWANQYLTTLELFGESAELKEKTMAAITSAKKTNKEVLWPLRVALSLSEKSPDVFDILVTLGKEESLRRIMVLQD